ncbi:MAG: DUF86 domain-containing protein [Candidatus Limnocylindria bacterium]
MRSDRERLLDIVEAIDRIERYTRLGRRKFEEQELVQAWVIHHIEIIGEASARVSLSVRSSSPDIPWAQIGAMRNVLVHDYFGIDVQRVWATAEIELPKLKDQVRTLLERMTA